MKTEQSAESDSFQPRHGASYYRNRQSLGSKFRLSRFRTLLLPLITKLARKGDQVRILDLGGAQEYWWPLWESELSDRCQVTICNLNEIRAGFNGRHIGKVSFIRGDARRMDFPDNAFDLVHSNSMIEHVGRWGDVVAAAGEIRRLAPYHFVQTPSFGFPVEPHYRLPLIHWLPEQIRVRIVLLLKSRYLPDTATFSDAMELVQSYQLLDRRQMSALFPESRIVSERFAGLLVKSHIAISE